MNFFQNNRLRILNFTHGDMDGAVSNIIIKNYYKNVITYTIGNDKKGNNDIIAKLTANSKKFDAIIFTDVCPENLTQVIAFGKPVLVLDHHECNLKYNNPKENIYIATICCASKMAYQYFNTNDSLKKLEELVNLTNDHDLYLKKDIRSPHYNSLFWKMGFEWFVERFYDGDMKLSESESKYLIRRKKEFDKLYKNLEIHELGEKGVLCESDNFIYELFEALKKDGYEWCMIYRSNGYVSIRSSEESRINLLKVCEKLEKGGGHKHAIGMPLEKNNLLQLAKDVEKAIIEVKSDELINQNINDDFMSKLHS